MYRYREDARGENTEAKSFIFILEHENVFVVMLFTSQQCILTLKGAFLAIHTVTHVIMNKK